MTKPKRQRGRRRPAWAKLGAIAIALLGLYLLWRYTAVADVVTVAVVVGLADGIDHSIWPAILLVLSYTPANFVMFPRPLITLFAALGYGPWLGFTLAMTGIAVSALVLYYTGRFMREDRLRKLTGEKFERVTNAWRGNSLPASIAVCIAPVAPFVVVGMVAGASRIRLWHFLTGTAVGMLPGTVATSVFANEISNALDDPSKINYWVVALVVAILIAFMFFSRHLLTRTERDGASA
ncbi:MAG TPA: VTT domain-containing protein [Burkholderiales bacterium]|nr:VTT domain-containing protein [Burkholderiales bacterium]